MTPYTQRSKTASKYYTIETLWLPRNLEARNKVTVQADHLNTSRVLPFSLSFPLPRLRDKMREKERKKVKKLNAQTGHKVCVCLELPLLLRPLNR